MTGLDMEVLLEKTITDEVIERYGRVNGYEDTEDEREKAKIAKREIDQRRKIKDDMRRILEEMSKARNDLNVEQPARAYDGLYMEESEFVFMGTILRNQMTTLRNQELVFENQSVLPRKVHRMEGKMSKRHRRQGGAEVHVPST
ncbi:hypothetical protein Scep_014357 [Stephania cephalantha]|uniref:Uncharacterized protein n=1 Tax=Stephania cephalantha TaxID=152367 RepID=A0AAP0J122_9MAGN